MQEYLVLKYVCMAQYKMECLYVEKESDQNFLCLSHTQNESVYMGGIYNLVLFYNTALH